MEQMASRAFSQVLVEIERRDVDSSDPERGDADFTNSRKKKKVNVNDFLDILNHLIYFWLNTFNIKWVCGKEKRLISQRRFLHIV